MAKIRLTESELRRMINESIKSFILENTLPNYENPVFIDCESEEDANYSVEIGYSDYSSSLFYVGCVYDEYDAISSIIRFLKENGILENYAASEEEYQEFPNDYIEVDGVPFRRDMIVVHSL